MKNIKCTLMALAKSKTISVVNLSIDTLSHPVCGIENGKVVDRFFIYSSQPSINKYRPKAAICFDRDSGAILKYVSCEVEDFASGLNIAVSDCVNYQAPEGVGVAEIIRYSQQLMDAYEELRQFAFVEVVDESQKNCLENYIHLLHKLVNPDLLSFYVELSPEFFKWATVVCDK